MNRFSQEDEDPGMVLDGVRWLVASLRMSGLENWMATPGAGDSVRAPAPAGGDAAASEAGAAAGALLQIREEIGDCRRCRLHSERGNIVFGDGSPEARLVFVGEGPGFEEDRAGAPFVGKAGKLLDKMIEAMGFRRADVYICNVVKCRPPKNRTPDSDEIAACTPFLLKQLEALRPGAICALGACAAQTLLKTSRSISALRGKTHTWRGIPLTATYHPAYLLREPAQKALAWQDLLELRKSFVF